MLSRAAALTLALSLLGSSAFAGTAAHTFTVGAVVVRSAVVSATANDGIQVQQVASRGTPPPMLLVAGGFKPMPQAGAVQVSPGSTEHMTVTIVY